MTNNRMYMLLQSRASKYSFEYASVMVSLSLFGYVQESLCPCLHRLNS